MKTKERPFVDGARRVYVPTRQILRFTARQSVISNEPKNSTLPNRRI